MAVDVLLFDEGIGLSRIRQEGISELMGIEGWIMFGQFLCGLKFGVEEFRVILGDTDLDTGGVVDEIIGFLGVKFATDRLGDFDKVVEHGMDVVNEALPEAGDQGWVREFIEAAELAQLGRKPKDVKQQGIRLNTQDFEQEEELDEAFERVLMRSAEMSIVGPTER